MEAHATFNQDIRISPSILSADFANFGAEIREIGMKGCDWVHVGVMGGLFVPSLTIGPLTCKAIRPHVGTVMDTHLMITPEKAPLRIGRRSRRGGRRLGRLHRRQRRQT